MFMGKLWSDLAIFLPGQVEKQNLCTLQLDTEKRTQLSYCRLLDGYIKENF